MTRASFRTGLVTGLTLLLMFTALRNLSRFYYVIPGAVLLGFVLLHLDDFFVLRRHRLPFDLFFFATLAVVLWSFVYMRSLEPLVGVPRALLMPVFTLMLFHWLDTPRKVRALLSVGFAAYVIGALSLIYQVFVGPVDWFADSSHRGGLIRYSTILGSLTIFGSVVGYAVVILLHGQPARKTATRMLLLALLLLAAFLSLQKSAILSAFMGLAVSGAIVWRRFRLRRKFALFGTSVVFVALALIVLMKVPLAKSYFDTTLVTTFGKNIPFVDTVTIRRDSYPITFDAITERLYGFTAIAAKEHGPMVYVTGVGLIGGAGSMGMEATLAHNGIGDLFLMGGPIYAILFIILYMRVQAILYRTLDDSLSLVLFSCNLLYLANLLVASGTVFQPSLSFVFWLSVVFAFKFGGRSSEAAVTLSPVLRR